ncbi:MAG: ubiquitin [Clostridium sartagoforme]|nr:ubiquitin [Clostridium sartagoforme]
MENQEIIEKLMNKAKINYEDAKDALENSNWDILDAILYLEVKGKVNGPSISTFYTNDNIENHNEENKISIYNKKEYKNKSGRSNEFQGVFEAICKSIDTCNNIFLEITKGGRIFLRIPMTVLILLLLFTFWIVIPLFIVGLFFDIEFYVSTNRVNTDKVNKILKDILLIVRKLKEEIKKGFNHG